MVGRVAQRWITLLLVAALTGCQYGRGSTGPDAIGLGHLIATADIIDIPGKDLAAPTNIRVRLLVHPEPQASAPGCEKDACVFRYYLTAAEFGESTEPGNVEELGLYPRYSAVSARYLSADQTRILITFADGSLLEVSVRLNYGESGFEVRQALKMQSG